MAPRVVNHLVRWKPFRVILFTCLVTRRSICPVGRQLDSARSYADPPEVPKVFERWVAKLRIDSPDVDPRRASGLGQQPPRRFNRENVVLNLNGHKTNTSSQVCHLNECNPDWCPKAIPTENSECLRVLTGSANRKKSLNSQPVPPYVPECEIG